MSFLAGYLVGSLLFLGLMAIFKVEVDWGSLMIYGTMIGIFFR